LIQRLRSAVGSAIQRPRLFVQRIWTSHRNVTIAVSAIVVVAIVATSALVVGSSGKAQPTPTAGTTIAAIPTASPTPFASPTGWELFSYDPAAIPAGWVFSDLDGRAAPPDFAHRLPLAVMIADNIVSRPQSGISTASIVYQAYADGGEDRYMMIWQEGAPTDIGPARSARPYYVYWAAEYKALYAHVGGDMHSLQQVIPAMSNYIYNMDELSGGSCPYRRITSRVAPQNDYTSGAELIRCAALKSYPATYQNLPTRPFRDDIPLAQRPASQLVTVPYRTYETGVGYQYDPDTDSYLRLVDGKPQIDPANGNQVYARNIVVMYQSVGYDPGTLDEATRPWVSNIGSGKATVFLEGKAIQATWKKATTIALTRFYDSSGNEIPFVRGEIFMQSVPSVAKVTVS
jgi:hypothetical protein